jgi:AcrR family transcriptional regulator
MRYGSRAKRESRVCRKAAAVTLLDDQDTAAPPGRRERNKLQKRARIVAAARALFEQQGFANTTTQQIADAADIGTGTLFLYARAKEDLLVMVFSDEMLETARQIFANPPAAGTIDAQLMAVFESMADYHARDTDLARLLLRELVISPAEARRSDIETLVEAIFDGLTAIISAGGQVADPPLVARSAFALYYFALISWLGGGQERARCMGLLRQQLAHLINGNRSDA